MNVQIFGSQKSRDTQKALRFFRERSLRPQFVDLRQREMAPGELRRFAEKFGLRALTDSGSKAYRDAGLEYLALTDAQLEAMLLAEPALMVQPLLRAGKLLALGWDEALWRDWYEKNKDGPES